MLDEVEEDILVVEHEEVVEDETEKLLIREMDLLVLQILDEVDEEYLDHDLQRDTLDEVE